jgi:hypothetical protein
MINKDLAMMNHTLEKSKGSLGVEEPYVMKKGKWMFNLKNQAYYEESYALSVNLYLIKK